MRRPLLWCSLLLAAAVRPASADLASTRQAPPVLSFFPVRLMLQTGIGAPPAGVPVSDGTRVFVALRTGAVAALSVDTGAMLWTSRVEARGRLVVDGSTLFVPTEGAVEALDPRDGQALWRVPVGPGAVLGVTAASGWLFVLMEDGALEARRAADGERVWTRSIGTLASAGPHVNGDRLFVGTTDGTVAAFRATDGAPLWSTRLDGAPVAFTASPERVYFGTRAKFFYSVDAENGRIDWRWRIGAEIVGAPALDDRHVYPVALDNQIRALDRGNGAQRWRKPLVARPIGSAVHVGSGVIPAAIAAEIRGLAARDGASQGRYPVDREVAAPVLVLPRPYAQGGELVVVLLADGSTLALQRRVEPALAPLTALPGAQVPLTPPPTPPAPGSPR